MPKFNNIWDITPGTAHPRAGKLVGQSILWNYGDEDSPLGNDIGADTFAAYLRFRNEQPDGNVEDFIYRQLASRGFSEADWDVIDGGHLEELLRGANGFNLLRRDDLIIALAFAQLLLNGALDEKVRRRAIMALSRQESDTVLSFRGSGGELTRKKQLIEFRQILEEAG